MTDQAPHRAMQQGTEAQNAQESTPLRRSAAKDLSLVTLVPKWGGADNAPPLAEFFEAIEGTAKIGNWTEADKIQVCVLRLTDNARDFYRATPELKDPNVTWDNFKAHFQTRFRDVRTAQYHFTQLHQARQQKNESRASSWIGVKSWLEGRCLSSRTQLCRGHIMTRQTECCWQRIARGLWVQQAAKSGCAPR